MNTQDKLTAKTNLITKSFSKVLTYVLLIILIFITQSCDTEIPEVDNIPPRFSFKITGDGFDRTFTEDDDYDHIQLNLKKGATYDFIFSGIDQGGVELIQWQLSTSYINFSTAISGNWTSTNVSALSRMIQWRGDASDPITAAILPGTFEADGEIANLSFRFFVKDFGGESRLSNTVSKELNIYIGTTGTKTEVISI